MHLFSVTESKKPISNVNSGLATCSRRVFDECRDNDKGKSCKTQMRNITTMPKNGL